MAELLSLNEIERLPVVPYDDLRGQLQSGDLLFAAGRYPLSRAIQSLARSPFSHVGIIFHTGSIDRKFLLESVEDVGVRMGPVSKYLNDYRDGQPYDGVVILARFQLINPEMVMRMGQFGSDLLSRNYDAMEVGRIIARIALNLPRRADDVGYSCSELVHHCFKQAGYDFAHDPHGTTTPRDIWADHHVTMLGRVL